MRSIPVTEGSVAFLVKGYAWLPDAWRRRRGAVVRSRLLGREVAGIRGPEAVRFFYDEAHVVRHPAMPGPVLDTLFGRGAVHTLDGPEHRGRKAMFLNALTDPDAVAWLAELAGVAWDEAVARWPGRQPVVLFDEAARVLTNAVCQWAGVPVSAAELPGLAADLIAMVDGFATPGPRHWRARRARTRREEWLAGFTERVRAGEEKVPDDSPADRVIRHLDVGGGPLEPRVAAVELLNVIRPAAAVAWFAAFAGHALHRWPGVRDRLRDADPAVREAYARAFAHELRRFYPFVPFLGGQAATDLEWHGAPIRAGTTILLDVYGQHHDPELWPGPYDFAPARFLGREPDPDTLIPQGGADRATGHRCPGEDVTIALIRTLALRLARLDYRLPRQSLAISLRRVPARPADGVVLTDVRPPGTTTDGTPAGG